MKKILIALLALSSIYAYANECNISDIDFLRVRNNSLKEMVKYELGVKGYSISSNKPGYKLQIGFSKLPRAAYKRDQVGYLKGNKLKSAIQSIQSAGQRAIEYIDYKTSWKYERLILNDSNEQNIVFHSKYLRRACVGNCGNWDRISFDFRSRKEILKNLVDVIPNCN